MHDGKTRYRIDKMHGCFAVSFRICIECCKKNEYHNSNCEMCQNTRYRQYTTKETVLNDLLFLMMLHSEN